MEKLIYPLWSQDRGASLEARVFEQLVPALLASPGVRGLRVCIDDDAVAAAAAKRMARKEPLPGVVLSLWVDDAGARSALESMISEACDRHACLLVTESEPIVNREHPRDAQGRIPGFCQVVFLARPTRLSRAEWLEVWQGSHTAVAIETQSTFAYRQNVVARVYEAAPLPVDAIVEENFPDAAMSSLLAFYDAADERDLKARADRMMASCARFIDPEGIDVIPMSEYVFGPLFSL